MLGGKKRRAEAGTHKKTEYAWAAFLLPSLAGVFVFVCLPFLDVVRRSFLTAVTQEWSGVRNYQAVFQNQAFLLAVKNTLRFTAVCLPLLVGTGLFLAVQIEKLRKIQLIKSLFLFPMALPAATMVLVWKMVFSKEGFLNLLLSSIHLLPEGGALDYMGSSAAF